MKLSDDITVIKGIGTKTAAPFRRAGVFLVYDLLTYYPSSYKTYPPISDVLDAEDDTAVALCVSIRKLDERYAGGRLMSIGQATVYGAPVQLVWFNNRFLKRMINPGLRYVFYGKISYKSKIPEIVQPQIFSVRDYEKIVAKKLPVYPKVFGLTDKMIEKAVKNVLAEIQISEYLPSDIIDQYSLCDIDTAFRNIHFPDSDELLAAAQKRLKFDEFFFFMLSQRRLAEKEAQIPNTLGTFDTSVADQIRKSRPYSRTKGQEKALGDVLSDFNGSYITQRLIQGDVGSGKTIVAFIAMAVMAMNGYVSAIMAPTEVLARQHYEKFRKMVESLGLDIPCVLLTGHVKGKARTATLEEIASGEPMFVIGTHALFQEKVEFHNLGLVITDEQHRFGVKQRDALSSKGDAAFSIVMSATPIPRTLALILYQGLNISTITEKPSVRKPLKNAVITPAMRKNAYSLFIKEIRAGHQGIIICPLVEPSENAEGENVEEYYERIRRSFPDDITIGKLYGPMPADEKEKAMDDFSSGKTSLIVSTTVIEVGVDVPDATVIMIEDAQKFGLAQLHQLRGRVGRGDAQGYCIFVDTSGAKEPSKRLQILQQSNDGFYLANADLKMRGPGDTFGVRQSGDIAFRLADIYSDSEILHCASQSLDQIMKEDPSLSKYPELCNHVQELSDRTYSNL